MIERPVSLEEIQTVVADTLAHLRQDRFDVTIRPVRGSAFRELVLDGALYTLTETRGEVGGVSRSLPGETVPAWMVSNRGRTVGWYLRPDEAIATLVVEVVREFAMEYVDAHFFQGAEVAGRV